MFIRRLLAPLLGLILGGCAITGPAFAPDSDFEATASFIETQCLYEGRDAGGLYRRPIRIFDDRITITREWITPPAFPSVPGNTLTLRAEDFPLSPLRITSVDGDDETVIRWTCPELSDCLTVIRENGTRISYPPRQAMFICQPHRQILEALQRLQFHYSQTHDSRPVDAP
jgi:hypothetical protein